MCTLGRASSGGFSVLTVSWVMPGGPVPASNEVPATALKQCRYGQMLYLRGDSYVGRSLDLYGEYGEIEGQVFAQVLEQGHTVVEVGANMGAHTVHLARLVGTAGTVLAFEPQRAMFYLLCANLALNEQFHVRAFRAAVGNAEGGIKVPVLDHRLSNNFGALSLRQTEQGDEVPLVMLDRFALPSLRLLKVDVEGMEPEVLLGARQTIARHRPFLYVENDRKENSERLLRLIDEFGYAAHWHISYLFNPDNFFNNAENVFPRVASINLLCVPREVTVNLVGFRTVTGPDDWWQNWG